MTRIHASGCEARHVCTALRFTRWPGKEVLEPFLANLDSKRHQAVRWWPPENDAPMLVGPEYGYGLPAAEGAGGRTETRPAT